MEKNGSALTRDLFGEIPVTYADVLAWMLAVPVLAPDSPRFWHYVINYRVAEKIARAKEAREFEAIIACDDVAGAMMPTRLARVFVRSRQ